jgi:hypothetical protein
MFKGYSRLPSALLALALSLLAAQAARAQDSGGGATAQTTQQGAQPDAATRPSANRPAPLEAGEKVSRSLRAAFLRPTPYLMSAFSAGITQLNEDRQPQKDNADEAADWGSRTARSFATRTTSTVFSSGVYPALFKQDPRYERSLTASALANVWERSTPGHDRIGADATFKRFGRSFISASISNVLLKEFGPDIIAIFRR